MNKISIIGCGSWALSLATVLANNNHSVLLYARSNEIVEELNSKHTCMKYTGEKVFRENIKATNDLKNACDNSDVILLSVPSKTIKEVFCAMNELTSLKDKIIVITSKGLINGLPISETLKNVNPEVKTSCLSGPSFAKHVLDEKITAVVSASSDIKVARKIQKLFNNSYFRVYTSSDINGVEYCGAIKNVIALASGMLEGKDQGANAKAALISRGLHEMVKFAKIMKIKKDTLYGLTGVGDLVLTSTDLTSRNYHLGYLLGQGYSLEEGLEIVKTTAEGIVALKELHDLSLKHDIDMPIIKTLYNIIYLKMDIDNQLQLIMARKMKKETI